MSLSLDKLKQKLEENPAVKGFYAATLRSRVVDAQVHAATHCTAGKHQQTPVPRTLEEVLKLDHSHDCMNGAFYMLSSTVRVTTSGLLHQIETLLALPSYDNFVSTEPSQKTFRLFLEVLDAAFNVSKDGEEVAATAVALEYLSAAKGYPADAKSIIDIFLEQFTKFHEKYLPPNAGLLLLNAGKQEQTPLHLVMLPGNFTVYHYAKQALLAPLALHIFFRDYQDAGSNFLVLPAPIFDLVYYVDPFFQKESLRISGGVTPERLLTAKTLCDNGMTLEDAWLSATKL